MPRTLSDQELRFYEQKRWTADLAESIFNDPQLGAEAKALIKRKHPNVQIPDFDLENKLNARIDSDRQEREEKERAKADEAERDRILKLRADTQKKYGFTDEAMTKLEQFMEERFVGDYDVAASYFAAQQPKPVEAMTDHFWNHHKSDDFKKVSEDPEAWGRTELLAALNAEQQRLRGGR